MDGVLQQLLLRNMASKASKSKRRKPSKTIEGLLSDPTVPLEMRIQMLHQVCRDHAEQADEGNDGAAALHVLSAVLEAAASGDGRTQYADKLKELGEKLKELQQGPMRCATFDQMIPYAAERPRAKVILPDGGLAFCAVPEEGLVEKLRCGDTVWLDAQGTAVLYGYEEPNRLGEEARLERLLQHGDLEVSIGELGRYVFRCSAQLVDQIERGETKPGSTLVVCPRQMIAWRALPESEGEGHRRYLTLAPPPDILVERDVGSPKPFIEEIARHVQRELLAPEIAQRFRVRRSRMLLATGVAGSGKSHQIKALWRRLYEVMAEVTGATLESLPQRVLKLEAATVLSKWLGETDQNIARFFDEVAELADERFVGPDGRGWQLPVLVICEEIDALARQRGEDAIHDRIQTTLLTRFDPAQALFEDRLVVVVCTTNIPSALDVAFVRRAGGSVASFGRVGRHDFRTILATQLRDRPFAAGDEGRRRAVADITAWLFAPRGLDSGLVELTYVGQSNTITKARRDFITAGLIDRAVQQAAGGACDEEWERRVPASLTSEALACAIDDQVRSVVDQLTPANCERYLTLPDAVRVGTVRRIEQPAVLPIALERAS